MYQENIFDLANDGIQLGGCARGSVIYKTLGQTVRHAVCNFRWASWGLALFLEWRHILKNSDLKSWVLSIKYFPNYYLGLGIKINLWFNYGKTTDWQMKSNSFSVELK